MTTSTTTTSWITMTTRTNRKDMTMTNTDLVEFKTIYPDIDKHYCLVTLANDGEPLSITKESLIKLLSLIGCE